MSPNFFTVTKIAIALLISMSIVSGCSSSNKSQTTTGNPSGVTNESNTSGDNTATGAEGATNNQSTSAGDTLLPATSGANGANETGNVMSGTTNSGSTDSTNNEALEDGINANEQTPTASNSLATTDTTSTTEPGTTRIHFDITVPVHVSNALQVRIVWGERNLIARWVTDESWAISDDFPINTQNPLTITFSDDNGALTLGSIETVFKSGLNESEVYKVSADQFEVNKWDDDDDGISNLSESIDGTNPLEEDILEPVTTSLELVADKTFRINWEPTKGARYYRILENPDGLSGYTQISDDLDAATQMFDHRVALFKRVNARYIVQACNVAGCVDSEALVVSGPLTEAIGYFKASNSDSDDIFGESVALNADGTVLAVGTYDEDSAASSINGNQNDNSLADSGAVYVFARSSTTDGTSEGWKQQAYIKASNPGVDDFYGFAISLSADGNTLAVGAANEDSVATGINGSQSDNTAIDSGAVYVYTNNDGSWQQQAYLKASNTNAGDGFGYKLRLGGDGNTLVVGANGEASNATGINGDESDNSAPDSGAVYVFSLIDGNWQQQAYLKASNTEEGDFFGSALGLSADSNTLAIGATDESSSATGRDGDQSSNSANGSGAVYVFERNNGIWQQQSYLKASNTDQGDGFGIRLSLSADGNTLAVAAYYEQSSATGIDGNQNDDTFSNAGAVYVFDNSSGNWLQQAYIKSSNGEENDFFGISVGLSGDGNSLVVGAFFEDSAANGLDGNQFDNAASSSGASYVFERSNATWQQQAYVKPSNSTGSSWFGFATSLSTDVNTLAVGARYESNNATGVNGNQNAGRLAGSGAVYLY